MRVLGAKLRNKWEVPYRRLIRILEKEIWETGQADRNKLTEFAYYLLRILSLVKAGFIRNNVFVRPAALCYSSLLALGPLAAIVLLAAGFVLERVEQGKMLQLMNDFVVFLAPPLAEYFESNNGGGLESSLINENLLSGINGLIDSAKSGAFGLLGLLLLFLIAIQLFTAIEKAFNDIWGVRRGRNWLIRIVFYWAFISLGAIITFTTLAVYSQGTFEQMLQGLPLGDYILSIVRWLAPLLSFLIILILLSSFYTFIPNTQVYFLPALIGAFVVSVLLVLNNYLSFLYVRQVVHSQSLYGSLGIISILMLALYVFWVFILVGGQITYAIQNANFQANQKAWENTSRSTREVLSLAALVLVARRFRECAPPYSATELSERLRVPGQILNKSLSNLTEMGFISILTAESGKSVLTKCYQPAKPLNEITLYKFKQALDDFGNSEGKELLLEADPVIREFCEKTESDFRQNWQSKTLDDLL